MPVRVKRDGNGKWTIANDMGLTSNINAPPTYDDVIADDEAEDPPPAYDSLPCSVRNSCELQTNQNGSVTIICVPNRDIHLYNEGTLASFTRCYSETSVDGGRDVSDRSSEQGSLCQSSDSISTRSRSLTSELEENCDESCIPVFRKTSVTSNRTDSNENLLHHKTVNVIDDDIEFMDEDV